MNYRTAILAACLLAVALAAEAKTGVVFILDRLGLGDGSYAAAARGRIGART